MNINYFIIVNLCVKHLNESTFCSIALKIILTFKIGRGPAFPYSLPPPPPSTSLLHWDSFCFLYFIQNKGIHIHMTYNNNDNNQSEIIIMSLLL